MSVQDIFGGAWEYEQWEARGTRTSTTSDSLIQRLFGLTHHVGTYPIVADPLFSRWVYDWASTLQFTVETRVVFDLCGRPNLPFEIDFPKDMGVWALTLPRFSVIFIDMSRRWKSLRLELHKAQFYRIWSEDALNVVLIKGWWHKGEARACKGEGIEVWLSRELWKRSRWEWKRLRMQWVVGLLETSEARSTH